MNSGLIGDMEMNKMKCAVALGVLLASSCLACVCQKFGKRAHRETATPEGVVAQTARHQKAPH